MVAGVQHWSLVLFPQGQPNRSKTGEQDDTVTIDKPELSFLHPLLERLSVFPATEEFVNEQYPSFLKTFTSAANRTGLKLVPSLGRHSGASIDAATNFRTGDEIMRMGRWKTMKSVRRYEKNARVSDTWRTLPTNVQDHCLACERGLRDAILFGDFPPAFVQ
jgi:hypothetical protein